MSRLQSWYDRCVELWKASKRVPAEKLTELAQQMDKEHGPWTTEGLGSRTEAVQHYVALGRKQALATGRDAAPDTPARRAFEFARDMARSARRQNIARPIQQAGDSLTGAIDKTHVDHYAARWASHNALLENVPRGRAKEVNGATVRVLSNKTQGDAQKPKQFRSPIVTRRMKQMQAAGSDPVFSMDDLKTIHTGVERAIHAGAVSESSANRYHVMRSAMKIVHDQHHDPDFPAGLPFKPSYAALDTESLKVMHAGVKHLDSQGFAEAKARLTPVLDHAVKAHAEHPYYPRAQARKRNEDRMSVSYPDLHHIDSPQHKKQLAADRLFTASVERRRTSMTPAAPAKTETKAPAAAPAPTGPSKPSSYDEYKTRLSSGETFSSDVHLEMAKLRRGSNMNKSREVSDLLKAWKSWREEAA